MDSKPQVQALTDHVTRHPIALRKKSIRKAITYHLAGLGESRGLVYKALETASLWLDSKDMDKQGKAMDIVIKLLPYVLEKEGVVNGITVGSNGNGTINVQINNFDTFLKDRLSQTNIGKLLDISGLQQASDVSSNDNAAS